MAADVVSTRVSAELQRILLSERLECQDWHDCSHDIVERSSDIGGAHCVPLMSALDPA